MFFQEGDFTGEYYAPDEGKRPRDAFLPRAQAKKNITTITGISATERDLMLQIIGGNLNSDIQAAAYANENHGGSWSPQDVTRLFARYAPIAAKGLSNCLIVNESLGSHRRLELYIP